MRLLAADSFEAKNFPCWETLRCQQIFVGAGFIYQNQLTDWQTTFLFLQLLLHTRTHRYTHIYIFTYICKSFYYRNVFCTFFCCILFGSIEKATLIYEIYVLFPLLLRNSIVAGNRLEIVLFAFRLFSQHISIAQK